MKQWQFGAWLVLTLLSLAACSDQAHRPAAGQLTLAAVNFIDPTSICTADQPIITPPNFMMLLSAGLLTGLSHCLGMCGPLVGVFAGSRRLKRQEVSTSLILFQLGRLTTYLILGCVLGTVGYLLVAVVREGQIVFSILLGLLMTLSGLGLLGLLPVQRWLASIKLGHMAAGWMRRLLTSPHPAAPFGLGLANGLLPCGPVYMMGLLAATSGDALKGAGMLLIFGLGTLPAMLGIGFSMSFLNLPLRSSLYRFAAMLVVTVGLQVILRGLASAGQISHLTLGSVMLW